MAPADSLSNILEVIAILVGDMFVFYAIVYESRSSRIAELLQEAHGKLYEERRCVYQAYLKTSGVGAAARAQDLSREIDALPKLRRCVHRQIAFFARFERVVDSRLFWWQRTSLTKLYGHVLIRLWMILHAYVGQTRPPGEWEKLFMRLAERSFCMRSDRRARRVRAPDGVGEVEFSDAELDSGLASLRALLKES